MRNRTIIIRLFFLFCFAVFPSAYAQDMSFNYLTTDNGLSQFTVYALYNDEWGQIWIGTRDGLNVYNGNRIKTYKEEKGNPTTLLGRTVRRICGNGKGLIYAVSYTHLNWDIPSFLSAFRSLKLYPIVSVFNFKKFPFFTHKEEV